MSRCRSLCALTILLASTCTLFAQSSSSFAGKWVFNPEKSIFSPGPLPRLETLTFENGTVTLDGANAQGKQFHMSWSPLPSEAVPVLGAPDKDLTVETKESGDTLVHMWSDHSGTSYGEGRISADGKTMRYVLIGTRWGNHVYEVSVFERQ